jgi:2-hydroxy-3-keto-5-methylthiopentenyl-1-phosphate phosphatase
MLIICDFDGTVTTRDTNSALARRFAPDAYAGLEGKLGRRELSLREVLAGEFADVTAHIDDLVAEATKIPLRDGFRELLDVADAEGHAVVLLSSGFHELIEPMLRSRGLHDRVPLLANSITFDGTGGRIAWRELPTCGLCGEPCKRHDVARLRDIHAGGEQVVFVGDGFSDRCGAESADRVFARDYLARYLDDRGLSYDAWEDFNDIAQLLGLRRPEVTG